MISLPLQKDPEPTQDLFSSTNSNSTSLFDSLIFEEQSNQVKPDDLTESTPGAPRIKRKVLRSSSIAVIGEQTASKENYDKEVQKSFDEGENDGDKEIKVEKENESKTDTKIRGLIHKKIF